MNVSNFARYVASDMRLKDVIGLALCVVGISTGSLGLRLLGISWFWGGAAVLFLGLLLVLDSVREKKLRENLKEGGPGDWGDRHYLSGDSAGDDCHSSDSSGDGGSD
jgi:hypothetical protein